jgi:hypothetical protein
MPDKLIETLKINEIEVKIFEDKHGNFYTENPEHILFVTCQIKYYPNRMIHFYPISDNYSRITNYNFSSDEIQDIYLKNPLNFPEKVIKDYYLKSIFPYQPPSKLKFDYPITNFTTREINKMKLLDLLNWDPYTDEARLKCIQDVVKMFHRKSEKAEVLSSFDCIGKISNNKEGLKLAKMLNSAGCKELYAKALMKYASNAPDTFEKILKDCDPNTIYNVYSNLAQNLKKAYHPDVVKVFPKMIQYVTVDFIKDFESIDSVEWNLFGTEYAPDINLKNASIDVAIYLMDNIKIKNKNELLDTQILILNKIKDFNEKVKHIEKMNELIKKLK